MQQQKPYRMAANERLQSDGCGWKLNRKGAELKDIYEVLLTPFVCMNSAPLYPRYRNHFSHLFAAKYFITKSAYVFNLTKIFSYTIILPWNLINARLPARTPCGIHFIVCCWLVDRLLPAVIYRFYRPNFHSDNFVTFSIFTCVPARFTYGDDKHSHKSQQQQQ